MKWSGRSEMDSSDEVPSPCCAFIFCRHHLMQHKNANSDEQSTQEHSTLTAGRKSAQAAK